MEALWERTFDELDRVPKRQSIELHVREDLEQDVDRIGSASRALELLSRQDGFVGFDERVEGLPDDDAQVLEAPLVDPLMDGRDELDQRDRLAVEDLEGLLGQDQGDRAAVPHVLAIDERVSLEQR